MRLCLERVLGPCRERAVEFVMPPKKEDWGTASIFKDVDGNQFVLSSR